MPTPMQRVLYVGEEMRSATANTLSSTPREVLLTSNRTHKEDSLGKLQKPPPPWIMDSSNTFPQTSVTDGAGDLKTVDLFFFTVSCVPLICTFVAA